jgi:hypothetical protein
MLCAALISLFITSTALATTWTVDDDGKADFDNIQDAIDAASDGDEIIVMPGTYTSTQDGHVVNMLGKAVTLRSSNPSDSDVVTATIIDGKNTRRGLACYNEETSKTIISSFTITNGFPCFHLKQVILTTSLDYFWVDPHFLSQRQLFQRQVHLPYWDLRIDDALQKNIIVTTTPYIKTKTFTVPHLCGFLFR